MFALYFLIPVLAYLLIAILMCLFENSLVYRGESAADHWESPEPGIEEVTFSVADGTSIHAWYVARPDSSDALLLCHGNAGNVSYRSRSLLRFRDDLDCSVLIFDYPGFGKSGGKPRESKCYEAAEAALKWLVDAKKIPHERVLLYGESLGGGVAVELAKRHDFRALVLLKTFTTLPDVAQRQYRWLPVRWIMRNRFDNLSKIRDLRLPIFISSATEDALVPFEMGKTLFDAANEPKMFFPLENESHNDKVTDEFVSALRRFLDRHSLHLSSR